MLSALWCQHDDVDGTTASVSLLWWWHYDMSCHCDDDVITLSQHVVGMMARWWPHRLREWHRQHDDSMVVVGIHSLRFSNTNLLNAPFVRTSFGAHSFARRMRTWIHFRRRIMLRLCLEAVSFCVAAPKIWNSPSISPYLYQSWDLLSSPQDPQLPAGLPIQLTPVFLRLRFGFCWVLTTVCVYKLYLLTYYCIH